MEDVKIRSDYLDILLDLSEKREIPYTRKQLEKMTFERLENIYKKQKAQELDSLNEAVVDTVIGKFDELMKGCKMIREDSDMGRKLQNKKLFRQDLKSFVGWFTPLFPYVGLLEGVVCVASEIMSNTNKEEDGDTTNESKSEEGGEQTPTEVPDNDNRGPESENSKL